MATVFLDQFAESRVGTYDENADLGTEHNGFRTWSAALAAIDTSADDIAVRGGDTPYRSENPGVEVVSIFPMTRSGTNGHTIRIYVHDPILEPVELDAEFSQLECIDSVGTGDFEFDGFEVFNAKSRPIHCENATNVSIKNCVVHENRGGIVGSGNNHAGITFLGPGDNCWVETTLVFKCGRGILFVGNDPRDGAQGPRNSGARKCIARDNGDGKPEDGDAYQCLSATDNRWEDCLAYNNRDGGFDSTRGSHRTQCIRCVAHGHQNIGNGDGNGFKMGVWGEALASDVDGGAADCLLEQCVAFDNAEGITNNAVRLTTNHCTSIDNSKYNYYIDESTSHDAQATVTNCIFDGAGIQDYWVIPPPGGNSNPNPTSRRNPVAFSDFNFIGDGIDPNSQHVDVAGQDTNSVTKANPPAEWNGLRDQQGSFVVGDPGFVNRTSPSIDLDMSSNEFPVVLGFQIIPGSVTDGRAQGGLTIGAYQTVPVQPGGRGDVDLFTVASPDGVSMIPQGDYGPRSTSPPDTGIPRGDVDLLSSSSPEGISMVPQFQYGPRRQDPLQTSPALQSAFVEAMDIWSVGEEEMEVC